MAPPIVTPPERMKPSVTTLARGKSSQSRPRGHHSAGVAFSIGSTTVPSARMPDGLAPTSTTGGTYSIARALMPVALLVMSSCHGITRSTGTPPGAKKAAYAWPLTRARDDRIEAARFGVAMLNRQALLVARSRREGLDRAVAEVDGPSRRPSPSRG